MEFFFIDLFGRLNSVGFGIKSAFIYVLAFDTLLGQDYTDIEQGYVFTAMTRFNVWGCGFIALFVNSERAFVIHPTDAAPQFL